MVRREGLATFDGFAVDLLDGRYFMAAEQQAKPTVRNVAVRGLWCPRLAGPPCAD